MKIKVLAENTAVSDEFEAEHGLSLYIETLNHKILYDSGQSRLFLDNAKKMNVPVEEIDTVVLSHGHYDHGGGLPYFMKSNCLARIYMSDKAFGSYYNAEDKFIGIDRELFGDDRITFVRDELKIDDELFLFTANNMFRPFYMDNYGLTKIHGGHKEKDDFMHEQYLIVTEKGKSTLFSGCSHKGILNILKWSESINIKNFVGGFHLMKIPTDDDGKKVLDEIQKGLDGYDIRYFTGHCTGLEQYNYLKTKLDKKLEYISTGKEFEIR